MIEPGADPQARGGDEAQMMVLRRRTPNDPVGEGGEYGVFALGCTRAELWAAIHTMAAEWYLWGKDGDDVAERVAKRGTERVRELLGLEPGS